MWNENGIGHLPDHFSLCGKKWSGNETREWLQSRDFGMVTPIHSVLRAGTGSYSVTVQYPLPCDHNTKLSVTMWLQHWTVSDHVTTTLNSQWPCDRNTKLSVTMWPQHWTVSDCVTTTLNCQWLCDHTAKLPMTIAKICWLCDTFFSRMQGKYW